MNFEKFNSIEQFRSIVQKVKDRERFIGLDDNTIHLLSKGEYYGN